MTAALAIGLAALFLSQRAWILDPGRAIKEFHHSRWTTKDGAPAQIYAMAQTVDGWLWLGTSTGLYRFDGIEFQRFKPQLVKLD